MALWECVFGLGLLIVFEENMTDTCIRHVDIIRATLHLSLGMYIQGLCQLAWHLWPLQHITLLFCILVTLVHSFSSVQSMHVGVHMALICIFVALLHLELCRRCAIAPISQLLLLFRQIHTLTCTKVNFTQSSFATVGTWQARS